MATIALQLYTVRDFMQDADETPQTLQKVADIGYRAVETAGYGGMEPADFRAACDDAGLDIIAAHSNWEMMNSNPDEAIKMFNTLGVRLVGSGCPQEMRSEEGFAEFAQLTTELGKKLQQGGITFQYHNHDWEFEIFNGKTAMQIMAENSDPEYFKFQLDLHWVQRGGGSPSTWIECLSDRLGSLHCKDMSVNSDREPIFQPVGAGNIDWEAIMEAAADAGVEYYIVEQDRCQRDPFEAIAISHENLSSWL
jgi:sugar phosphate isomerase/epimerase